MPLSDITTTIPAMRGETHVCLTHRIVSRTNYVQGSYHCPRDGAPMVSIGTRRRVPKRGDDEGWQELREWVARQKYEREWRSEKGENALWGLYYAEKLLKKWRRQ